MNVISSRAAGAVAVSLGSTNDHARGSKILAAGEELLPFLERGQSIRADDLRAILTNAF